MHPVREQMTAALKALAVPTLRELGFSGSLPHFRRLHEDSVDLVTFQFYSSGGSFVVELAVLTQAQVARHARGDLSLKTATVYDSTSRRRRLGAPSEGGDHWFVFGKRNYETGHDHVEPREVYDRVARDVAQRLSSDAQAWFADQISGQSAHRGEA